MLLSGAASHDDPRNTARQVQGNIGGAQSVGEQASQAHRIAIHSQIKVHGQAAEQQVAHRAPHQVCRRLPLAQQI